MTASAKFLSSKGKPTARARDRTERVSKPSRSIQSEIQRLGPVTTGKQQIKHAGSPPGLYRSVRSKRKQPASPRRLEAFIRKPSTARVTAHEPARKILADGRLHLITALDAFAHPSLDTDVPPHVAFDEPVCRMDFRRVIESVLEHRPEWRASGRTPRCYAMMSIAEVTDRQPELLGSIADAGLILLGGVRGETPDERGRWLETRLAALLQQPTSNHAWPRPSDAPRADLEETAQEIADIIVAASATDRDRCAD